MAVGPASGVCNNYNCIVIVVGAERFNHGQYVGRGARALRSLPPTLPTPRNITAGKPYGAADAGSLSARVAKFTRSRALDAQHVHYHNKTTCRGGLGRRFWLGAPVGPRPAAGRVPFNNPPAERRDATPFLLSARDWRVVLYARHVRKVTCRARARHRITLERTRRRVFISIFRRVSHRPLS